MAWAGNYTPDGWLVADGSCVSRETYARLFEVIGLTYTTGFMRGEQPICNNDNTLFALPWLAGRVIVGAGTDTDLVTVYALGQWVGAKTHTLTIAEMPSHTHAVGQGASGAGAITVPIGPSRPNNAPYQSGATGGDQPHNNMQPSLVLNYLIWAGTETLDLGNGGGAVPTAAPEIYVYSTVEADGVGQPVVFAYAVTAGDFILAALLIFAIGLYLLGMLFRAREQRHDS